MMSWNLTGWTKVVVHLKSGSYLKKDSKKAVEAQVEAQVIMCSIQCFQPTPVEESVFLVNFQCKFHKKMAN